MGEKHIKMLNQALHVADWTALRDAGFKTLDSKIDLTRDLLLVEMKVMQASMETNIAKLNNSLELERRVAKIENAQAAERKDPPTEQRIA